MHASIEQLLSVRDADPIDAQVAEHVRQCATCSARLRRLAVMRERLQNLPQSEPPGDSWEHIRTRFVQPRSHDSRRGARVVAGVAVGAVFLIGAVMMIRGQNDAPEAPLQADDPPQVAAPGNVGQVTQVADLVAQSQHLDYLLQSLPERPHIERVSTAATIDTIEERIAWLDFQLSDTPARALSDEQARRLWSERVELMDSLVKVRYAEAGHSTF
jgi:hypothetical protein